MPPALPCWEKYPPAFVELTKIPGLGPKTLVMILAGHDTFSHLCELSTGVVIDPDVIVPHLSRVDIQTIVFDGAGRPMSG